MQQVDKPTDTPVVGKKQNQIQQDMQGAPTVSQQKSDKRVVQKGQTQQGNQPNQTGTTQQGKQQNQTSKTQKIIKQAAQGNTQQGAKVIQKGQTHQGKQQVIQNGHTQQGDQSNQTYENQQDQYDNLCKKKNETKKTEFYESNGRTKCCSKSIITKTKT